MVAVNQSITPPGETFAETPRERNIYIYIYTYVYIYIYIYREKERGRFEAAVRLEEMEDGGKTAAIPLLESGLTESGTASTVQTLANIVVSIVGTGVLGLPFAFRIAGWLAGSLGVVVAGVATYYCMLLLVSFRLSNTFSISIEF